MSSNSHFNPLLPKSGAASALRALPDRAAAMRAEGSETDAATRPERWRHKPLTHARRHEGRAPQACRTAWAVPRRLLIEERLDDGHPDGPIDYIFFCFDGVPRLVQVGSRSHTIHRFFTPDWEAVQLTYRERYETPHIPRPAVLSQMLEVAAALSAGFDFVRVDLYCCGNDIRFGELTFTPRAGWIQFKPAEWDIRLGDWWHYRGLPDA